MVIAEVRAAHVPVEIFRFQVKGEHVSQNGVHCPCDVFGSRRCEIGRRFQWRFTSVQKFYGLSRIRFFHSLTVPLLPGLAITNIAKTSAQLRDVAFHEFPISTAFADLRRFHFHVR